MSVNTRYYLCIINIGIFFLHTIYFYFQVIGGLCEIIIYNSDSIELDLFVLQVDI